MRKRILGVLALLLSLFMLCGCAAPGASTGGFAKTGGAADYTVRFEDIEYVRPDVELMRQRVEKAEQALEDGGVRAVIAQLDKCYEEYYNFYTMYSLADIRTCQDVTDPYYAAEFDWLEDNFPVVQQLMEDVLYACGGSELAQRLEEEYFWEGFTAEYGERDQTSLNDEIVKLMRRESELLAQYRALTASTTIEVDGAELDFYSYISGTDGEEYDAALSKYYNKYNEELARIYIELVKVRRELADSMGFESYEQMQYYYGFERDYSPEQASEYISDIKEYMVPFYLEVSACDPYASISYDSLSESRLHDILQSAVKKMGGDVEEAFDFMSGYGYYDIRFSPNKAAMSFQTYLTNYEAPFLFLDPYGDMEDVLSFSHEFGHYVDAYVNYDAYESIDVSECFSQSMEYLMLSYFDGALSQKELDNLYRMKMMDTLELYVQQASFAEFESVVYAADPDELSAKFLNDLSLQLAIDYGYYDGVNEEYYALSWTDITHFYEQPFYVISYAVSNDAAMQIYELEQQREGLGLDKYLEMLPRNYEGLIDTLSSGGLESPFREGRIEKVVQDMRPRLTWSAAA